MDPNPFMNSFEGEIMRLYDKDVNSKNIIETDKIEITFDDMVDSKPKKSVYICGCIKNCERYLEQVFSNIERIVSVFDDYKVIMAEDSSEDNSKEILLRLKNKYKMDIINVPENKCPDDFTFRSKKISNARNAILNHINNLNEDDFQYFIMLDMDDVSAGSMDINVLKNYMDKEKIIGNKYEGDWDSLSFNRKRYYDIWALSVEPYVFSCFHFPGNINTVEVIRDYITKKIEKVDKTKLMECYSAFNGFAIYRKQKFINCLYDWQVKNVLQLFSDDLIRKNEKAFGLKMSLTQICHPLVNPSTDCEHRYFHMIAIKKNNAKIRISPLCLFTD
jgi:hypothetical protein